MGSTALQYGSSLGSKLILDPAVKAAPVRDAHAFRGPNNEFGGSSLK